MNNGIHDHAMGIKVNGSALGESIFDDIEELFESIHGAFLDRVEMTSGDGGILEKFWVKNVMVNDCC